MSFLSLITIIWQFLQIIFHILIVSLKRFFLCLSLPLSLPSVWLLCYWSSSSSSSFALSFDVCRWFPSSIFETLLTCILFHLDNRWVFLARGCVAHVNDDDEAARLFLVLLFNISLYLLFFLIVIVWIIESDRQIKNDITISFFYASVLQRKMLS